QDDRGETQTLESLAISYDILGDTAKALQAREERLKVAIRLQDPQLQRQALSSLKMACIAQGDFERVKRYIDYLTESI
ncbi:MAG: tetratricopeptide repeat protein, partial [Cyanobacteria bacterium P01_H01_bin.152]